MFLRRYVRKVPNVKMLSVLRYLMEIFVLKYVKENTFTEIFF